MADRRSSSRARTPRRLRPAALRLFELAEPPIELLVSTAKLIDLPRDLVLARRPRRGGDRLIEHALRLVVVLEAAAARKRIPRDRCLEVAQRAVDDAPDSDERIVDVASDRLIDELRPIAGEPRRGADERRAELVGDRRSEDADDAGERHQVAAIDDDVDRGAAEPIVPRQR